MTIESNDEEEEEVRKPTRKEPVRWDKVETEKGVRFKEPVVEKPKAKLPEWPYVMVPLLPVKPLAPFKENTSEAAKTRKSVSTLLPVLEKIQSYKNKAPIEDEEALRRIVEELINTKFTTSLKDLASVSAPAREYLKKMITRRKVAIEEGKASDLEYHIISLVDMLSQKQEDRVVQFLNFLDDEDELPDKFGTSEPEEVSSEPTIVTTFMQLEELPHAQIFCAQDVPGIPNGAFVLTDPVEQYLNSLAEGEEPRPILVARESVALRTVFPTIHKSGKAEVLLDTGSQICSMDADIARNLGISWDPDVVIHLQSANRTVEKTLGLARNVEFDFGGVVAYIQLHIIRRPAYSVLLGRPFDVAMSSEVSNHTSGDQSLTLKDPNTGRRITIPAFPKGKPPPHIQKELWDQEGRNFRNSRI